MLCGPPADINNTLADQIPALTAEDNGIDWLNHKFFAWCPKTMVNGPTRCGKMDNKPLVANLTMMNIIGNNLKLADNNKDRKYDSCYYEFKASEDITDPSAYPTIEDRADGIRIFVQITKAKNMNIYLWGGQDRESATKWLVKSNRKAVENYNYTYDASQGIFMVAYPDKDKDTEFEFRYWVDAFHESWVVRLYEWNFEGDYGQKVLIIFVVVIVILVILLIGMYICCVRVMLKDSRVNAYEMEGINNTSKGPESTTNTYAGELETVEDEMDDENIKYRDTKESEKDKSAKKKKDKKDKKYKKEDPDSAGEDEDTK